MIPPNLILVGLGFLGYWIFNKEKSDEPNNPANVRSRTNRSGSSKPGRLSKRSNRKSVKKTPPQETNNDSSIEKRTDEMGGNDSSNNGSGEQNRRVAESSETEGLITEPEIPPIKENEQ